MYTDCPQIKNITNGFTKCTKGNKVGSECTYFCKPGKYKDFSFSLWFLILILYYNTTKVKKE